MPVGRADCVGGGCCRAGGCCNGFGIRYVGLVVKEVRADWYGEVPVVDFLVFDLADLDVVFLGGIDSTLSLGFFFGLFCLSCLAIVCGSELWFYWQLK